MPARRPPLLAPLAAAAAAAALVACPADDGDSDDDGPDLPDPICHPATVLPEGAWFTDVTAEVGLTGVTGNRLATADLDGDHYPDLVVEPVSVYRTDEAAGIRRYVLMNRPGAEPGQRVFVDETAASGFHATRDGGTGRASQLKVFADIDNDGDLDAFSGVYADLEDDNFVDPGDRSEVLLNDGSGRFTLGPQTDLWRENGGTLAGAAFTDYDRDGLADLYVGFWYKAYGQSYASYSNRLYRNRGGGEFRDVTEQVGMDVPTGSDYDDLTSGASARPTYGVTACDVDGDGDPDLLGSSYGRAWNELWLQDGGAFTEVGREAGFAGDEDEDYCDNQYYVCACSLNEDFGTCSEHPPCDSLRIGGCEGSAGSWWGVGYDDQPFRNNGNTFSTVCGDIDNDGDLDLYNAEIRHWHIGQSSDPSQLLINEGGSPPAFSRPGNEALGMAREWDAVDWNEGDLMAAFLDFDNDGYQDVFLGTSDYPDDRAFLFRQRDDGTFAEVAERAGIAHPQTSGIAIADFDRDGDLDVAVGSSTARNDDWETQEVHLYRNDVGQDGNSLRLRLHGTSANRAGIGARVTVEAGGTTQTQEVSGGYGHMGMHHDVVLHFGLGESCTADRVTVRWPDAQLQVEDHRDVRANELTVITQGGALEYAARP